MERSFPHLQLILLFVVVIFSCSPSIHRIGYKLPSDYPEGPCDIPMVNDSTLKFDERLVIGTIEIGDPGAAINCGAKKITEIIQMEACRIKADLINIKKLKPPDFWSSCYRLTADFIKFHDTTIVTEYIHPRSYYDLEEAEKYFEGVHIDSLEVLVRKFRISIGTEISMPAKLALNSYIYLYGFGLSYSYGFSASTSDPEKHIRDIRNSHHLRISYSILSLQNVITFIPIYFGYGKSYLNEKEVVQGLEGSGRISASNYFIGLRTLSHRKSLFNKIGTYIEFGKSNWDYGDSILEMNNSDLKYNYSNFYSALGLSYYLY